MNEEYREPCAEFLKFRKLLDEAGIPWHDASTHIECSRCHSHTDYHPTTPFNFCPVCGAFHPREELI